MNPLNYASLEASKRLVEAGIVLETDAVWVKWYSDNYPHGEYRLVYKALVQIEEFNEQYPAPCMAEVWRELPDGASIQKLMTCYARDHKENVEFEADNPTDALINLLIWQRKEANHA